MRKILIGVGVLLVVGIAALLLIAPPGTGQAQSVTNSTTTATVERTTLYTSVEGTGVVEAAQIVELSFEVSGTVAEVGVDVGDSVTEGQRLAALDTSDLAQQVHLAEQSLAIQQATYDRLVADPTEQEIAQAEAQLAQAQAQLESAQASATNAADQVTSSCANVESALLNLEEAQDAYDDYLNTGYEMDATFIPDSNSPAAEALRNVQTAYDTAQAQCNITTTNAQSTREVESAQASLEQAQAAYDDLWAGPSEEDLLTAEAQLEQVQVQLEQAQADLDDATILAPFDGVITDVQIIPGQTVNAAAVAMTVADTGRLHVDVSVDELDISQVAVAQTAQVTLEAFDDVVVAGTVARISPAGEQDQGLVTYTVRVDLNTDTDTATAGNAQTQADGSQASVESQAAPAAVEPGASTGFVPGQAGGAQGGVLREVVPVLTQMGGPQALAEMVAGEGGTEEFYTLLRDAGVSEETIAAIEEMGGPQALVETMGQGFGPGTSTENAAQASTGTEATGSAGDSGTTSQAAAPTQDNTGQQSAAATLPIRLGMTAEVEIVVSVQEDVLVVPTSAIQSEEGEEYLLVESGTDTPTRVPVTTGDTSNGMTVISGEVSEGQVVYIPVTTSDTQTSGGFGGGFGGAGALLGGGGRPPE